MVETLRSVFTWIAIACCVGVFILVVDVLASIGQELWFRWQQESKTKRTPPMTPTDPTTMSATCQSEGGG